MGKGRDLTGHQQKIVKRYYEHKETIAANTLGEIVSDLYLATADGSTKKIEALWKRAEKALANTLANRAQVQQVLQSRQIEALARLAGDVSNPNRSADKPG